MEAKMQAKAFARLKVEDWKAALEQARRIAVVLICENIFRPEILNFAEKLVIKSIMLNGSPSDAVTCLSLAAYAKGWEDGLRNMAAREAQASQEAI